MTPADLDALLGSWKIHLEAERKSPHTIRTYTTGVTVFARWCAAEQIEPAFDRATVEKFTSALRPTRHDRQPLRHDPAMDRDTPRYHHQLPA